MRTFTPVLVAAITAAALSGCALYFSPFDEEPAPPEGPQQPPGAPDAWLAYDFEIMPSYSACTGARFVRYAPQYELWIGAILCDGPDRYKLYLGPSQDDLFLEIADYSGHGQDHCELVNPDFRLPDDGDITSGGCEDCAVGELIDPIDVPVYARSSSGEPFALVTSIYWADLTTSWYRCGVAIP
jgi:hypothetical protein